VDRLDFAHRGFGQGAAVAEAGRDGERQILAIAIDAGATSCEGKGVATCTLASAQQAFFYDAEQWLAGQSNR